MRRTTQAGTSQAPVNWHDLATASHYQTAVLESHLIRLMQHIIKWRLQSERRSWSRVVTIRNARFAIARIQQDTPSLTRQVIESLWDDMVLAARYEAEGEMNRRISPVTLTWEEAFETEYILEEAARDGDMRVIDESGEDYLYSASYFVVIEMPLEVKQAILQMS